MGGRANPCRALLWTVSEVLGRLLHHMSICFLTRWVAEESVSCLVESVVEMEGKSVGLMLCTVTVQEKGKDVLATFLKSYSAAMLGKRTLEHGKAH